jgi:hypothetical protein
MERDDSACESLPVSLVESAVPRIGVKRLVKVIAQVGITGLLCTWLFSSVDWRGQMAAELATASWPWLGAAFVIYGSVEFFAAVRWQFILRDCGLRLPWAASVRILLISVFLNTVVPGLVGGDAYRVIQLARTAPERKRSGLCATLVDRFFGLVGLIALGASFVLFRYNWLHKSVVAGRLADITLCLLCAGVLASCLSRWAKRSLSALVPSDRAKASISDSLCYHPTCLSALVAFASTAAAHLSYCASFYCTARAFEVMHPGSIHLLDMMTITPIVSTFTSLPISLSGIGVRESIFGNLLHDLDGVPFAIGVLTGSIGFVIRMVWAIAGALAVSWRKRRCGQDLPRVGIRVAEELKNPIVA